MISSPDEEQGKNRNIEQLESAIAGAGIERYYLLDSEGNSITGGKDSTLGTRVLTAMFATIFAAAETSFYEIGIEDDLVVNLESQKSGTLLLFKLNDDMIIVLDAKKNQKQVRKFMETLKTMTPVNLNKIT